MTTPRRARRVPRAILYLGSALFLACHECEDDVVSYPGGYGTVSVTNSTGFTLRGIYVDDGGDGQSADFVSNGNTSVFTGVRAGTIIVEGTDVNGTLITQAEGTLVRDGTLTLILTKSTSPIHPHIRIPDPGVRRN